MDIDLTGRGMMLRTIADAERLKAVGGKPKDIIEVINRGMDLAKGYAALNADMQTIETIDLCLRCAALLERDYDRKRY